MYTFASLATLTTQTAPYALLVAGNALAPDFADGQTACIRPQVNADPATIAPGTVVLAAIAKTDVANAYDSPGLWKLNADKDLICGTRTIEAGKYLLLGTAHTTL